jgi:hypothetical protein
MDTVIAGLRLPESPLRWAAVGGRLDGRAAPRFGFLRHLPANEGLVLTSSGQRGWSGCRGMAR